MRCLTACVLAVGASAMVLSPCAGGEAPSRFPGAHWPEAEPESVGLDPDVLVYVAAYLGGRGCIVRHGQLVYAWGDAAARGDVASAAKPWYTTLLLLAVEEGLLPSVDAEAADYVPGLSELSPELGHKDRDITFAHMANQVSCYGVAEAPGSAFDYNDWQMALLVDTLLLRVYGASWDTVDRDVLGARLTDALQCEDEPTLLAFGEGDRPGRLAVSPRDFARFGWLILNGGAWNGGRLLPRDAVQRAVSSPLSNSIPRTRAAAGAMLDGQRSLGSQSVPDDQTDHLGSYSWAWWVNGVDRAGRRLWPDAPADVFAALGHQNGQRGMAGIPSLDLVIAWNDTTLGDRPERPHPLNEVFRSLLVAADDAPLLGQPVPAPGNAAWLVRHGADATRPFIMCGPGDPEGFLYRGERLPDGTRNGDQEAIVKAMRGTGANCLYLQAVRSHGGDGDATHNPFVDSDPAKGLDERILQQWDRWFHMMDEAGITAYLFIYDDSASIWDTGDVVGDSERAFLTGVVDRFEHRANLIWCVAEESEERFSPARIRAIAEVIREADEHDHIIAVHRLDGLKFGEFADDANIDQFAVQYNKPDADDLYRGMASAWNDAAGRYHLNLAEAAEYGFGREARRKHWAAALGGAHAMAIDWSFDAPDRPSRSDLKGCGLLVSFLESIPCLGMAPHPELAAGGTAYVLAEPGVGYVAYAPDARTSSVIRDAPPGAYAVTWYDPVTGVLHDDADVAHPGGELRLRAPQDCLEDAAVWIRRTGAAGSGEGEHSAGSPRHALVQNGWLVHDGRAVWGWIQHNGWWRAGQRPNLTRRSVGDPLGDVRPNRTEDLERLTSNMLRYAYPGFEHNYGLWYDRRRDAHDTAARGDGNVQPPFLEQPWARSAEGRASDGLPLYDLTRFNDWYFDRLARFAGLCDGKGTVLFHKYHMQHSLLEQQTHYVDFPWRPANCVQATGLPDAIPAANAFYDMSDPVRRDLQLRYIRHCLDVLGGYRNVVHLTAQEYTGPLAFAQFWIDAIADWERHTGRDVCVGLGTPKDVQDAILEDGVRGPQVDVIDMRYWWYRADGSLFAPNGGEELPGRGLESGSTQADETSPEQLYRKVREYRDRYPDKAIIDAVNGDRVMHWAFFMGGGSLLVRGQIEYEGQADPVEYERPAGVEEILTSYQFVNEQLADRLVRLRPLDGVASGRPLAWCLADPGRTYLVYLPAGGEVTVTPDAGSETYSARWFDPETGSVVDAADGRVSGGRAHTFTAPQGADRALLLEAG